MSFFVFDMVGSKKGWQVGLAVSLPFSVLSLLGFAIMTNLEQIKSRFDIMSTRDSSITRSGESQHQSVFSVTRNTIGNVFSVKNPIAKKDNSIELGDLENDL